MTAEVVTMNKGAVAMAADSAITIIGKKVYNSGSKLFPLSKNHPIGIMFYGNAALMGVPWETIVAEYRRSVLNTHFDKVEQFGTHFLKFLGGSDLLFPTELQRSYVLNIARWQFRYFFGQIDEQVRKSFETNKETDPDEVKRIVADVVIAAAREFESHAFIEGATEQKVSDLVASMSEELFKIVDEIFGTLPLNADERSALIEIVANIAHRRTLFPGIASGVVFCGFGSKEIYPAMFSVEIESVIDGMVRCKEPEINFISDGPKGMDSFIRPFAQQDVAQSFLRGIDPSFREFVDEYLSGIFTSLPDAVASRLGEHATTEVKELVANLGQEAMNQIRRDIENISREKFVNPVLSAVQVLPKDELATMAETLVSLTSFRRRMSLDVETVGGPVDVAVISRKDGFVWIKRKHYFDAGLNPNFIGRQAYEQSTEKRT